MRPRAFDLAEGRKGTIKKGVEKKAAINPPQAIRQVFRGASNCIGSDRIGEKHRAARKIGYFMTPPVRSGVGIYPQRTPASTTSFALQNYFAEFCTQRRVG